MVKRRRWCGSRAGMAGVVLLLVAGGCGNSTQTICEGRNRGIMLENNVASAETIFVGSIIEWAPLEGCEEWPEPTEVAFTVIEGFRDAEAGEIIRQPWYKGPCYFDFAVGQEWLVVAQPDETYGNGCDSGGPLGEPDVDLALLWIRASTATQAEDSGG
jgi:hypothetical protein